jgi:hypothetical protein
MIRGSLRRRRKKRAQAGHRQPTQRSATQERIEWARQREQEYGCQGKKAVLTEWRKRWHEERGRKASWPESIATLDQPSQSCIKLYSQLKKSESLALFQARTGRIGLWRFLVSARVPEVDFDKCLCRKGKETAEHVLLHCDNTPQQAWSRGAQFRKLVSEPAVVGQVAMQLIQCGRLGQFSLASRLLYSR